MLISYISQSHLQIQIKLGCSSTCMSLHNTKERQKKKYSILTESKY